MENLRVMEILGVEIDGIAEKITLRSTVSRFGISLRSGQHLEADWQHHYHCLTHGI
jgi:hypothetical protein